MGRTSIFAAAVAAFMLPASAEAGEWRLVSATRDGLLAVDVDSIVRTGANVTAWTLLAVASNEGLRAEGIDYVLIQERFDCAAGRLQALAWSAYKADGSVVAHKAETGQWRVAFPDSTAQSSLEAVCEDSWKWNSVVSGSSREAARSFNARALATMAADE